MCFYLALSCTFWVRMDRDWGFITEWGKLAYSVLHSTIISISQTNDPSNDIPSFYLSFCHLTSSDSPVIIRNCDTKENKTKKEEKTAIILYFIQNPFLSFPSYYILLCFYAPTHVTLYFSFLTFPTHFHLITWLYNTNQVNHNLNISISLTKYSFIHSSIPKFPQARNKLLCNSVTKIVIQKNLTSSWPPNCTPALHKVFFRYR